MEQSIEPSFFLGGSAVGSVDSASIGSQANYGRSHCLRYIIRWRSEVSFSSPRFRGGYDQLFVADAVFEGKSRGKRKREDGQGRCAPSCRGVPSLLSSSGECSSVRHAAGPLLDGSKFRELAERSVRVGWLYERGRRCRSGPGERKLWQLSTDESNRPSPRGLLEAHSLLIYNARIRTRASISNFGQSIYSTKYALQLLALIFS